MNLTDIEKFKLREISGDPVVRGVIQRMIDEHRIQPYRPTSRQKESSLPGEQYDDWVFGSGILRGIQIFAKTIGYEDDRQSGT